MKNKKIVYTIAGVMLLSFVLIVYAAGVGMIETGLFGDVIISSNASNLYIFTVVFVAVTLLFLVYAMVIINRQEADASQLINWLRGMQDLLLRVSYPLSSDVLRPLGSWVATLIHERRGWVMLAQVPGLLLQGEVVRRKYLPVYSSRNEDNWDLAWAENFLLEKLDNHELQRFGEFVQFPEEDQGQGLCWMVRSESGELAVGIFVAIATASKTSTKVARSGFLDDILDAALDNIVKHISMLYFDVIDRREQMGSEGFSLLVRMLSHELSGELQGVFNHVDSISFKHPEVRFGPINSSLSRSHYWLEVLRDIPVFGDSWMPISPAPILLSEILNEILIDTRNAWPEVAFITKKSPEDLKVIADAPHLKSILRNVIYNAASFVPIDGLVRISIDSSRERFISIFIEDDGPGVPSDIAEAIFDPFRPSEKRPSGHKGMGVGLAVARIIGRSYGGDVICHSKPAQEGGCFEIILPKAIDESGSI